MPRHKNNKKSSIMQATRSQLLDAVVQELATQGFDKANVNHIAEKAGFSIGTLYNYFPTKRDMMYAFIDEISLQHVTFIIDRVLLVDQPSRRLETFFESGFEFIEHNFPRAKAIFNTLHGPDEDFKLRLFQSYQPLFQLLAEEVISHGIQQGVFHQVNPQETASLIMLVYLGAGSQFNREGKLWITAQRVSAFVMNSLRGHGKE